MKINWGSSSLLVTMVVLVVASSTVTWIVSTRTGDPVQVEAADSPGAVPAFIPLAGTSTVPRRPLHTAGHVVSGDAPGLYGGTEANSCDIAAMQGFLATHPDRAAAWATALMIDTARVGEHLASLTPVTLQTDTAVTNHGFDSGAATPFQTVLQAGTAVLVDAVGIPRVRCYCGNPLQTPAPRRNPRYEGARWDGFDAQAVTEIHTASTVIQQFVIVERDRDGEATQVVSRPRATRGERDEAVAPAVANDVQRQFRFGLVGPGGPPSTPVPTSIPATPSTVPSTSSAVPGPPPSSASVTPTSLVPTESSIAPTPAPGTTSAAPVTSELPAPPTSTIPESESPATTEDNPAPPATEEQPEVEPPETEEGNTGPDEGDAGSDEGDAGSDERDAGSDEGDGGSDEGDPASTGE